MGKEIDLMKSYPRAKRDVFVRGATKTDEDRRIARQFGREFFDGSRDRGYGGFSYSSRFWGPVIPTFREHWGLTSKDAILDVGCAKGFMLFDLQRLIPGIKVHGIDISEYAIENAKEEIRQFCEVGNATDLPFEDNSFDIVISITTLHNLEGDALVKGFQEVERVSRRGSFITVDAYENDEQQERMYAWNLTAKTIMHVDEWRKFFRDVGYTGDYYWFMP